MIVIEVFIVIAWCHPWSIHPRMNGLVNFVNENLEKKQVIQQLDVKFLSNNNMSLDDEMSQDSMHF